MKEVKKKGVKTMNVKIDVSGNVRFVDEISVLGVATEDGTYRKNVFLKAKTKKRITNYSSLNPEVHAILIYRLIKDDLPNYGHLHICEDVGASKLKNCLRILFKDDKNWQNLDSNNQIKIKSVKHSYVDSYVKAVRNRKETKGNEIKHKTIEKMLELFRKGKNKSRR